MGLHSNDKNDKIDKIDKLLVYEIVQANWLLPSEKECKVKHIRYFLDYMNENCNQCDIRSLFHESSPEGIFEVLYHLSEHLMTCRIESTNFPHVRLFQN